MGAIKRNYMLRYAADAYWLIDMTEGRQFKYPVQLNEVGAYIWKMAYEGQPVEDIALALHGEYGVDMEEARRDVADYLMQLKQQGFDLGMD